MLDVTGQLGVIPVVVVNLGKAFPPSFFIGISCYKLTLFIIYSEQVGIYQPLQLTISFLLNPLPLLAYLMSKTVFI